VKVVSLVRTEYLGDNFDISANSDNGQQSEGRVNNWTLNCAIDEELNTIDSIINVIEKESTEYKLDSKVTNEELSFDLQGKPMCTSGKLGYFATAIAKTFSTMRETKFETVA